MCVYDGMDHQVAYSILILYNDDLQYLYCNFKLPIPRRVMVVTPELTWGADTLSVSLSGQPRAMAYTTEVSALLFKVDLCWFNFMDFLIKLPPPKI